MDDGNYIYAQAKVEYTKQLIDVLMNNFFDMFVEIYNDAKKDLTNLDKISLNFRNLLENVPKWNQTQIDLEVDKIIVTSKCDWIDDLLTAVYITHTKILISVGKNNNNKKIDLIIPKTNNFIHKCYISMAREFWKNPYLFQENIKASDYQKNIKLIEHIICEGIELTIRTSLPVRDILKGHLESNINNSFNDESETKDTILNSENIEGEEEEEQFYYEGPSDAEIEINTSNIKVNDDLLKEDDKEEKYDNIDIFKKKENDTEKFIKLVNGESETKEDLAIDVEKNKRLDDWKKLHESNIVEVVEESQNISLEPVVVEEQNISLEPVVVTTPVIEETIIEEPVESQTIVNDLEEPKYNSDLLINTNKVEDKIIKIDKDDTDTLENFVNDLNSMSLTENKNKSYSLFN